MPLIRTNEISLAIISPEAEDLGLTHITLLKQAVGWHVINSRSLADQ